MWRVFGWALGFVGGALITGALAIGVRWAVYFYRRFVRGR